jgi:hypothetical protein
VMDREFFTRIKERRADPSRQSVNNPAPDYYGEKVGSPCEPANRRLSRSSRTAAGSRTRRRTSARWRTACPRTSSVDGDPPSQPHVCIGIAKMFRLRRVTPGRRA